MGGLSGPAGPEGPDYGSPGRWVGGSLRARGWIRHPTHIDDRAASHYGGIDAIRPEGPK